MGYVFVVLFPLCFFLVFSFLRTRLIIYVHNPLYCIIVLKFLLPWFLYTSLPSLLLLCLWMAGIRSFIVKAGDDIRQEQLAMQLLQQFKEIFENANLPLWLRPFVEIVSGSASFILLLLFFSCAWILPFSFFSFSSSLGQFIVVLIFMFSPAELMFLLLQMIRVLSKLFQMQFLSTILRKHAPISSLFTTTTLRYVVCKTI